MNDEGSAFTWSYLILKVKQSWCTPELRWETWKDQAAKITETKWAGKQLFVPLSLLSWHTRKTKILKKKAKPPFPSVVFNISRSLGFLQVPLHKCVSNPNVFVIYNCNCLHFSETATHEIQGHGALIQKNAQDSVKIEKKQSLTLYVHIWWPKALIVNGCRSFYTGFTVPYKCSSLTTLKQGEALYMASREENRFKIRINQALFAW